jgi:hypothetical protein
MPDSPDAGDAPQFLHRIVRGNAAGLVEDDDAIHVFPILSRL